MNKAQAAAHTYHVAKLVKGDAKFAFDLRRQEGGGLGISNVQLPPDDTERHILYAHFGSPISARSGSIEGDVAYEGSTRHEPGTPSHFVAAVHMLPPPYVLVAHPEK
jgi:hypothetical protein